jgi:hypothetical protein
VLPANDENNSLKTQEQDSELLREYSSFYQAFSEEWMSSTFPNLSFMKKKNEDNKLKIKQIDDIIAATQKHLKFMGQRLNDLHQNSKQELSVKKTHKRQDIIHELTGVQQQLAAYQKQSHLLIQAETERTQDNPSKKTRNDDDQQLDYLLERVEQSVQNLNIQKGAYIELKIVIQNQVKNPERLKQSPFDQIHHLGAIIIGLTESMSNDLIVLKSKKSLRLNATKSHLPRTQHLDNFTRIEKDVANAREKAEEFKSILALYGIAKVPTRPLLTQTDQLAKNIFTLTKNLRTRYQNNRSELAHFPSAIRPSKLKILNNLEDLSKKSDELDTIVKKIVSDTKLELSLVTHSWIIPEMKSYKIITKLNQFLTDMEDLGHQYNEISTGYSGAG